MRLISNENDAWTYLEEWVAGTAMEPVSFSDWPRLEVHIVGDDYHSSLNTEQMEGYLAFQAVLNRSFCALKKGHYDSRYLTKSEEDSLRIGVEVKEGSSVLETDLSPLVSAVSGSIGGASPNLVIAGLILVGLSITAIPVIKAILEFRTKKLDSAAQKNLSELLKISLQERSKIGIYDEAVASVISQQPQFKQVIPDMRAAYWQFVSSGWNADTFEVAGLKLSADDVHAIGSRRRGLERSKASISGEFVVTGLNRARGMIRLTLQNEATAISARTREDQLSLEQRQLVFKAFADATPLKFRLQITRVENSIVEGRVIDFKAP